MGTAETPLKEVLAAEEDVMVAAAQIRMKYFDGCNKRTGNTE